MLDKAAKNEESEGKSERSDDTEDEYDFIEESPCKRYHKINKEVSQRNVPGIDRAFLAMDCEEGVEVVWNEVQFSERKSYKAQEEKIRMVFDNLTRIEHANIVKFHRYWVDPPKKDSQKTRVVFITEYMSSGSVKKFLNKTKEVQKSKSSKSWKRWCRQILSALGYLHMCDPPIVHGNLTCDTIFIQHNGLLKIGSVAPDAIRNHVKTYREIHKNLHYFAPECTDTQVSGNITPAVDIYSFGICCLEMAMSKAHLATGENKRIGDEDIGKAIALLEDPQQQHFIQWCISKSPEMRPSARDLLLHPLLYEVPSLKLISAHSFVKNLDILSENHLDVHKTKIRNKTEVIFSTKSKDVTRADFPAFDVDKFLEDVRVGIYPLTTFSLPKPPSRTRSEEPSELEGKKGNGQHGQSVPNQQEALEIRKITVAQCCFLKREDEAEGKHIILQVRFEDKMNRQLRCDTGPEDTPTSIITELVTINFIREEDRDLMIAIVEDASKQPIGVPSILTVEEFYATKLSTNTETVAASTGVGYGNGDFHVNKPQSQTGSLDSNNQDTAEGDMKSSISTSTDSNISSLRQMNVNNSSNSALSDATTNSVNESSSSPHPSTSNDSNETTASNTSSTTNDVVS